LSGLKTINPTEKEKGLALSLSYHIIKATGGNTKTLKIIYEADS
jgi:hypothetical protein